MRITFALIRILVAAAIVAAIVGQLVTSYNFWLANGLTVWLSIANFFSFFTIESNVGSVVVLLIGAFFLVSRRGQDPRWFNLLRFCVVTYMGVTGIVYNLLLRNIELPQGATLGWSNEILHVWAPIYLVLDWVLAPGRSPLNWKDLRVVVIFPILWAVYTLIRGPFTPGEALGQSYWYPYPFLNPNLSPNGYLSVAFYVILIAVFICTVAAGAIWVSKRKAILKAD